MPARVIVVAVGLDSLGEAWRNAAEAGRADHHGSLDRGCGGLGNASRGGESPLPSLLEEAKREIAGERFGSARVRLSELLARRPGWDEAWYNLGVCEQARQRPQAAWEAFDRVSASSDWAGWSDVRRSRIAMDRGRFAECEDLLIRAARTPGPHVAEARWGLVLLLRMQGRFDEAARCLQAGFDQMSSPVETLRRLYKLDVDSFPIEGVRRGWTAPADRLPTTIASGWLAPTWRSGPVTSRRPIVGSRAAWAADPTIPAVWRMKLEWALAADRVDEVRLASSHLPADEESPGRAADSPGLAGRSPARPRCRATRPEGADRGRPGRRSGS